MNPSPRQSPKIIYLRPRAEPQASPKRTNQTDYQSGRFFNGDPATRSPQMNPESIRGAWIGLKEFGYDVGFNDSSGLKLNGRPISLDDLMKLTNRVRRENGLVPVGRKREWLT
jgi:hypothetical protein